MSIVEGYEFEAMVGDPDDHRPDTRWALLVDPGGPEGRVDRLAVITERIAPGDRIAASKSGRGASSVRNPATASSSAGNASPPAAEIAAETTSSSSSTARVATGWGMTNVR